MARNDIQNRQNDAERQARQGIDKDAVEAIDETRRALKAITDGKTDEAIAAIERATGKIDVLTSRQPKTALLAVDAEAFLIDSAPDDIDTVRDRASLAVDAAVFRDFPAARVLLAGLISEIRGRTYHLPLATYPTALREAARLLEEHKNDQARAWLQAALGTLVVIDRVTPLPLILTQVAIAAAEDARDRDREAARNLLTVAHNELERALELGYLTDDDEYKTLRRTVSDLEKQLRGNDDTTSAFARLKQRIASFFNRVSDSPKDSQGEQQAARKNQQSSPQSTQSNAPRPQPT
jgi:hypothetical protein